MLAAISDEVIAVYGRTFGRAPAGAETIWEEDILVCVLEGIFTPPELTLVEAGRFDQVRADRQALRDALEPTFRALVETLIKLPVRAYMTELTADDAAFEAFVLGQGQGENPRQ